jgi:hypothetical protein
MAVGKALCPAVHYRIGHGVQSCYLMQSLRSAVTLFFDKRDRLRSAATLFLGKRDRLRSAATLFFGKRDRLRSAVTLFFGKRDRLRSAATLFLGKRDRLRSAVTLFFGKRDRLRSAVTLFFGKRDRLRSAATLFFGKRDRLRSAATFVSGSSVVADRPFVTLRLTSPHGLARSGSVTNASSVNACRKATRSLCSCALRPRGLMRASLLAWATPPVLKWATTCCNEAMLPLCI